MRALRQQCVQRPVLQLCCKLCSLVWLKALWRSHANNGVTAGASSGLTLGQVQRVEGDEDATGLRVASHHQQPPAQVETTKGRMLSAQCALPRASCTGAASHATVFLLEAGFDASMHTRRGTWWRSTGASPLTLGSSQVPSLEGDETTLLVGRQGAHRHARAEPQSSERSAQRSTAAWSICSGLVSGSCTWHVRCI